jgi:toxin ParE1/3/4
VKRYRVTYRPAVERDFLRLYEYIASEGSPENAAAFVQRIEDACLSLETFPERGTRRDDLRPRLRIMGFERRVTIAFQVGRKEVVIVRILYAGQDYERALRRQPPAGG